MWLVFLYYDKNKKDLLKIIEVETIKELSYLIDMKLSVINNYYHKLIKPRGVLEYILLLQVI